MTSRVSRDYVLPIQNFPKSNTCSIGGVLMERKIAALFVDEKGIYSNLPHVEAWGVNKDARKYNGPYPVVAHPPCERWGSFWRGSIRRGTPNHKLGDDDGCFESALDSVRKYGGVIEHPRNSKAWQWFGIKKPNYKGGWVVADTYGGFTCCVEQCHYGHLAAKPTWLYAYNVKLPNLIWGHGYVERIVSSAGKGYQAMQLFDDNEELYKRTWDKEITKKERSATPIGFRDLLIGIAQTAGTIERPQTLFAIE